MVKKLGFLWVSAHSGTKYQCGIQLKNILDQAKKKTVLLPEK